MNLSKSIRGLATDINAEQYDSNDDRFNTIFDLLDKDSNGTLSKEETYALVRLFELEKNKSKSLKNYMGLVVGASALVILLLGVCTFGAVFVAVKATKDTQVSSSGALMNKEGSRMLSTVALGTRFQLFNTSENTPLCIVGETFDIIESDILQGSKVVLDVEEEGLNERTILSLDAATKISPSGTTCFHSSDGKEHCFADAEPGECTSFGNPDERRQLNIFRKMKKAVESTASKAAREAKELAERTAAAAKQAAAVAAAQQAAATAAAQQAATSEANAAQQAATAAANAAQATANAAQATANKSIDSMKAIALGPVYQASVVVTNNAMKQAKVADAALGAIEAGAKIASQGMMVGVMEVAAAGVLVAEWVEANYCQISVSILLGTMFAALLYRPEPASVATTTAATAPLSSTAILYLAAKESVGAEVIGIACDFVAEAFVTLILMISDIKNAIGAANEDILTDAIAMTLAKSIDVAAGAMIIPQSCAAVVAGVITTLTAQLVCLRKLPSGAAEWGMVAASGVRMLEEEKYEWEGGN